MDNTFNSDLLNSLFETDPLVAPMAETLYFKEDLLGGTSLADINGNIVLETMPSAAGGENVTFENGETAHLTENIYGSSSLDFQGISNDIVGRPSIFGQENFYQNGEHIGTLEPNFMGTGYDFTSPTGETLFTSTTNGFGDTQVTIDSSLFNVGTTGSEFDLQNSFSEIETVASQMSVGDLGSATDAMDGLDILGLF